MSAVQHAAKRLRAAQLVRLTERRRLATGLEAAVSAAEHAPVRGARVPVAVRPVRRERGLLLALAARLRDPAPVGARGVARARRLLTDGDGPLYRSQDEGAALHAAALDALQALAEPDVADRPAPGRAG